MKAWLRVTRFACGLILASFALGHRAEAQALNVSCGFEQPSSSYAANSGQSGTWDAVQNGPQFMTDTAGQLTGVTFTRTNGTFIISGLANAGACLNPVGDQRLLYERGFTPNGPDPDVYELNGLQNGFYDLFIYSIELGGDECCFCPRETLFLVDGSPGRLVDSHNGGPTEGRHWTQFRVEVTENTLRIQMIGYGSFGQFSGFQLVPTTDPLPLEYEEVCLGDGGMAGCTPCPCGNDNFGPTPGGCLNSEQRSGLLFSYESRDANPQPLDALSVSAPPLQFGVTGLPRNAPVLLFSGADAAPVNPTSPCFGTDSGGLSPVFDGLRCASNDIRRHGVITTLHTGNSLSNSFVTDFFVVDFAANGFVAGQSRVFQAVYRDLTGATCNTGLNTTQGIRLTLTP